MIDISAAANGDDVIVSWRIAAKLKGCLGFALQREIEGAAAEFLSTSMPFEGQAAQPGENHPSSVWPIQRFVWTDHLAASDVRLRYRVAPVEGSAEAPTLAAEAAWSAWTGWLRCATGQTAGLSLFPNRGVVAAPWVDRALDAKLALPANAGMTASAVLGQVIATPGDHLRDR